MTQDNEKWSTVLDKETELTGHSPQKKMSARLPRLATLVGEHFIHSIYSSALLQRPMHALEVIMRGNHQC